MHKDMLRHKWLQIALGAYLILRASFLIFLLMEMHDMYKLAQLPDAARDILILICLTFLGLLAGAAIFLRRHRITESGKHYFIAWSIIEIMYALYLTGLQGRYYGDYLLFAGIQFVFATIFYFKQAHTFSD